MLELFKRMWIGWNAGVRRVMGLQSTVLMGVAYVLAVGPVSLVLRVTGRDLLDRGPARRPAASYWLKRDGKAIEMKQAARQF